MKEAVRRIELRMDRYLEMTSSSNQAGEFESMIAIVEQMMRSRDNDASVEKVVDRVIETEGQFDGRNITKFLDAYKREMNQRYVPEARCRENPSLCADRETEPPEFWTRRI